MVRIVNDIKYLKEYTKHLDPNHQNDAIHNNRIIDLDCDSEGETPVFD